MRDELNDSDLQLTVSCATETYAVTLNASESCKADKDMGVRWKGSPSRCSCFLELMTTFNDNFHWQIDDCIWVREGKFDLKVERDEKGEEIKITWR